MSKRKHFMAGLTLLAAAALTACGGGSDSSNGGAGTPGQPGNVTVQTVITDNLSTEYSKVLVSVKKISMVRTTGFEVPILDYLAESRWVDLASLESVGKFLSTATIPFEQYIGLRITLENKVQLVSKDGQTTINAKFQNQDSDFAFTITGLPADVDTTGRLVLDFDLKNFTYNASTGLVTPTIKLVNSVEALKQFVGKEAEVHGAITAIDSATQTVTVNDKRLGANVKVNLAGEGVVSNLPNSSRAQFGSLQVGTYIGAKGTVMNGSTVNDPIVVTSSLIYIEGTGTNGTTAPTSANTRANGEGKIISADGGSLRVALSNSNFASESNIVNLTLSRSAFDHGTATDLGPGMAVSFSGQANFEPNKPLASGAVITALLVDLKGAPTAESRPEGDVNKLAYVEGAISGMDADGLYLVNAPSKISGPAEVEQYYRINTSKAVFAKGGAHCLALPGAKVSVTGMIAPKVIDEYQQIPPPNPLYAGRIEVTAPGCVAK